MYLYTPKPHYRRTVQRPAVGYRPSYYATVREFVERHFAKCAAAEKYQLTDVVSRYYPSTKYYSPFPCRTVPVRGFQFPVELFDETVID